jgi:hypothetical protein
MKNNKFILLIIIFIVAIILIARFSYSLTTNIESDEYEIKNNIIYAVPTTYDYKVAELLSKLKSTDVEIYNSNNQLLNMNDNVGTGYKLKVSNSIYDIVVLGDITGDGLIQIGDIAALYNHYKSNRTIDGLRLESGKLTNNNSVTLGDVAKLYNYYKGHKAFSYYSYSNDILNEDEIESLTLKRVNEIRNTQNSDISKRTGKVFYVSNDGSDSNDGLSEEKPLKTTGAVNQKMNNGSIPSGSTILFRDGDEFKGFITMFQDDIMLGSYGDISKGKPILNKSLYNGAKEGEWVEVKHNIWKYTLNGSDQVFDKNVGTMWFFCNEGNNNCSKSMSTLDKKFEYAQMITTNLDYDETNIIDNIDTILTNDLEYYHVGHAYNAKTTGKELYLYSTSNPATRFNDIEFNMAGHSINANSHTNIYVDNIKVIHSGAHGIGGGGTMANLVVTNCEFGFVGGIVQNYNNNKPTRFGNAIEIYGSVMDKGGYSVDDGFIVDNNYIYQCYDAGPTFQLSTDGLSHMEKARFSNNVLEYNNYNIEYWNYSRATSGEIYDNSYIQNFVIENNIMRYAGYGISQTRPDKSQSAHIKTWNHNDGAYNVIKGNISIRNNIFYKQSEQAYFWKTNGEKFPVLANNVFYGMYGDNFGYSSHTSLSNKIKFNDVLLEDYYPTNRFIIIDKPSLDIRDDSGISNEVNWNYDSKTYTLSISGNGRMADYSEDNRPPWYKYVDYIYKINIGEGITYIGHYAFADLYYVNTFRIDSVNLSDLSVSSENVNYGDNFTTYNMGISSNGTTVIIGENVTRLPKMLFKGGKEYSGHSFIKNVIFEGNKVTHLMNYSLAFYQGDALVIPEGVKNIYGLSLGYSKEKILILPNSIKYVSDWSLASDSNLEKLVFGESVNAMLSNVLNSATSLKTLIINHINDPNNISDSALKYVNQSIDVYGDETTQTWVNKQISECGKTNLIYHNISEYKSSIISNSNINAQVGFNESYTFESNKNIKIYYRYVDSSNKEILFDGVDYTKNGNVYTINNIRNDIYIEVE